MQSCHKGYQGLSKFEHVICIIIVKKMTILYEILVGNWDRFIIFQPYQLGQSGIKYFSAYP